MDGIDWKKRAKQTNKHSQSRATRAPKVEKVPRQRLFMSGLRMGTKSHQSPYAYVAIQWIKNSEIVLKTNSGQEVIINIEEVRRQIGNVFEWIYKKDPEKKRQIKDFISKVNFKDLSECNTDLNIKDGTEADQQTKQKPMPYYSYNGDRTDEIYYSTDASCYEDIPNMQDDYRQYLALNKAGFVRKAFMAVMVHEFGHLVQRRILNQDRNTLGEALFEHYNVLFHENKYPGRKRGLYNKFNPDDFKMYFKGESFYYRLEGAGKLKTENSTRKKGVLKLQDPNSVNKENFFKIISALKNELETLKRSEAWGDVEQPQKAEKANLLPVQLSIPPVAPSASGAPPLVAPPASGALPLVTPSTSGASPVPKAPPALDAPPPPVARLLSGVQSQQQGVLPKSPFLPATRRKQKLSADSKVQINVFSEIIGELGKKHVDKIDQQDFDFLRSLMFMLLQDMNSYKWYHEIFLTVMRKEFNIDSENYTDLENRYWYNDLDLKSPNEKEKEKS